MTSTLPDYDRRGKLALGAAVVCVLFIVESAVAHRSVPNPASPYIWSVLGAGALGALVYALWCRRKARKASVSASGDAGHRPTA